MKRKYAFGLLLFVLLPFQSLAHTQLQESMPSDGAMLMEPPSALQLTFSAPVNLLDLKLVETGSKRTLALDFTPTTQSASTFSYSLPSLAVGNYQVSWSILGGDGHQMEGNFSFMVHGADMPMSNQGDGAGNAHNGHH